MTIKQNPDKSLVHEIKQQLKSNNGYCPCRLTKSPESKCMCKEFRDMIENGEMGYCHCGLYVITGE